MNRAKFWLCSTLLGLGTTGCVSGPTGMGMTHSGSLAEDLAPATEPQKARLQRPDQLPETNNPNLPAPPPGGIVSTSALVGKKFKVSVRAWVNGKPLFEEEVFQGLPPQAIQQVQAMAEPQRSERLNELVRKQIETVIDQEILYQEAVNKLEKNNPKALEKIKGLATAEYEKRMRQAAKDGRINEEQLREQGKLLQRMIEREFISRQYIQSRIYPLLDRITYENFREYYDTHINEFQRIESADWQDVFISVERHGSVEKAKRFAEELVQTCRTSEDFNRLLKYDDGTASKFNNGKGFGTRRGDIKPPEVESALFKLRDGEIGPIVDLPTGVHIIRMVKREAGGTIPFDENTQRKIREKLRAELADREAKRVVRDLRSRATIEIDEEIPQ